jgi:hypothetical protein
MFPFSLEVAINRNPVELLLFGRCWSQHRPFPSSRYPIKMKTVAFLLTSMIMSVTTALDKPESMVRHAQADGTRDLLFSNANARCERKLSSCESATGGAALPIQEWTGSLAELDSDLVNDLEDMISQSARVDFSSLVASFGEMSGWARILKIIQLVRGILAQSRSIDRAGDDTTSALASLAEAVDGVSNVLEQAGGVDIDLIVFILTSLVGFIIVLPQGPIPIVIFLIQTIIAFITRLSTNLVSLTLSPKTDPECMEALMLCDYNNMMLTVVPDLIDEAALASGGE